MFHVGQHVVCVKRGKWKREDLLGETHPHYGQVFTVRAIDYRGGRAVLRFEEIRNPAMRRGPDGSPAEVKYWASRFRPLQDSCLDIFRQLLVNPPKQGVDA